MADTPSKLTVRSLRRLYEKGERLVTITAYDTPTARFADDAGVHIVLVGDSMGMAILGYPNTVRVTLEQSLHHSAAVVRGVKRAVVIGDMPFLSFQLSPEQALANAGRYLQEAGVDGVKVEGGRDMAPTVKRLTDAGIPVLGHIGLLPQKVVREGYRVYGRTQQEADSLMEDALALQEAGAFGIIVECVPAAVAKRITEGIRIPTIGIGAGVHCGGQVQVIHDLLGMFEDFVPKHAKRYANLAPAIRQAIADYAKDVQDGTFPGDEQTLA